MDAEAAVDAGGSGGDGNSISNGIGIGSGSGTCGEDRATKRAKGETDALPNVSADVSGQQEQPGKTGGEEVRASEEKGSGGRKEAVADGTSEGEAAATSVGGAVKSVESAVTSAEGGDAAAAKERAGQQESLAGSVAAADEGGGGGLGKEKAEGEGDGVHDAEGGKDAGVSAAAAKGGGGGGEGGEVQPKKRYYKKRKVALLVAYNGKGYQGMQRNPGAKTIEGALEKALYRAGAILEEDLGDWWKIDWMRAARTDKGVSALGQVVSARLVVEPEEGFVGRVNAHLPKQIRLLGFVRVTAGFNAKDLCDRRRYEYVLPTFAFDPRAHRDRESLQQAGGGAAGAGGGAVASRTASVAPAAAAASGGDGGGGAGGGGAVHRGGALEAAAGAGGCAAASTGGAGSDAEAAAAVGVARESGGAEAIDVAASVQQQKCENGPGTSDAANAEAAASEGEANAQKEEAGKAAQERKSEQQQQAFQEQQQQQQQQREEEEEGATEEAEAGRQQEQQQQTEGTAKSDASAAPSPFVFDDAALERLNGLLAHFVGTHCFHNYTVGVSPHDSAAKRHIVSFVASPPVEMEGVALVKMVVVGQSFMLHQIRKMVGMVVAVMRGHAPERMLTDAFRKDKRMNVPMAPELGLFLVECMYPGYNRKWGKTHDEVSLAPWQADVDAFRYDVIYPHIVATEKREHVVAHWLANLNDRNYKDFAIARAEAQGLL